MTTTTDGSWQPLSRLGFRARLNLSLNSVGRFVGYGIYVVSLFIANVLNDVLDGNVVTRLLWLIAAAVVVGVAFVVGHALRNPTPHANLEAGLLRVGSRELPFHDIDWAVLTPVGKGPRRSLLLRLGATKGLKIGVFLRSGERVLPTDEQKALLVRVVRASSIAMPQSSYDPKGSFARYNFPGHLDADTSVALIEDPPGPDAELPIVEGTV